MAQPCYSRWQQEQKALRVAQAQHAETFAELEGHGFFQDSSPDDAPEERAWLEESRALRDRAARLERTFREEVRPPFDGRVTRALQQEPPDWQTAQQWYPGVLVIAVGDLPAEVQAILPEEVTWVGWESSASGASPAPSAWFYPTIQTSEGTLHLGGATTRTELARPVLPQVDWNALAPVARAIVWRDTDAPPWYQESGWADDRDYLCFATDPDQVPEALADGGTLYNWGMQYPVSGGTLIAGCHA